MEIFGDLKKLSPSEKNLLGKLKELRSHGKEICEPNLAKRMAAAVQLLSLPVALLVSREGRIEYVILGTKQRMYLPDLGRFRLDELKLRRLRLLVFWPAQNLEWCNEFSVSVSSHDRSRKAFPVIHSDFITDLEKLRLDCVLLVSVENGEPGACSVAVLSVRSNTGAKVEKLHARSIFDLKLDFEEFISELERSKRASNVQTKDVKGDLAVLVGAYSAGQKDYDYSIAELQELARSAGLHVADVFIQRRRSLDPRTILGKGKIEELMLRALDLGADLLVFDMELSPSQLREITNITEHRVIDRSMLILDIFAQRAKSSEGKLQVELAQLKYNLPRLTDRDSGLSRLTGGVGGRGPGETKLEIGRRRARDRIVALERKIETLSKQRQLRRSRRSDRGVPIIGIVGYTNAGKSTLLNSLSKSDTFAEDKLFATLDPSSRRMRFPNEKEVIFVDTVGFIRNLPKELMGAFRATLEELTEADVLLHVVDASSSEARRHIEVVKQTLEDLNCGDKPVLLVLNKCDLLSEPEKMSLQNGLGGLPVSAVNRDNLSFLITQIIELMNAELTLKDPGAFLEYPGGN